MSSSESIRRDDGFARLPTKGGLKEEKETRTGRADVAPLCISWTANDLRITWDPLDIVLTSCGPMMRNISAE